MAPPAVNPGHQKAGGLDVLRSFFTRKKLADYETFLRCSSPEAVEGGGVRTGLVVLALVFVVQKILALISLPLKWTGIAVEFLLNLFSLNGGLLGLAWHFITCSVTIPDRNAASFRSIIAQIDGRLDLYTDVCSLISCPLQAPDPLHASGCLRELLDLTMIASKVAYENEAYIMDAVDNHWNMRFVEFFNCWNKFLSKKTTQAFIFCDRVEDANLICVAFRGTQPFDAGDWSTAAELSTIFMGHKMGRVHRGFMKALGLQDGKDFAVGFPVEQTMEEDKPLAYYAIRATLRNLLGFYPNAKVVVTGHGAGAALACLFASLLVYHEQKDILGRIGCVVAHGQPRVGDEAFACFMEFMASLRCYRVVYRYDVVPRLPSDLPPLSLYKHFGTCIYYEGWRKAQVVVEVPNKNYFNPLYLIPMYWHAWGDLIRALFVGWVRGKEFREGWVSISLRVFGLLVPGVASHGPRDYVNAARLSKLCTKSAEVMV